jgi:hypothetical protein
MNIVLTVITGLFFLVFVGVLTYLWFKLRQFKAELVKFISPVDEKTASPLTQIYDQLIDRAGKIITLHIKTTLMGNLSAQSRQIKGIEADIADDVASQQSPLLAGLLNSFPTLKKRLTKNPQLLQAILPLLANLGTNSPGKNGSKQEAFDLNRFGG